MEKCGCWIEWNVGDVGEVFWNWFDYWIGYVGDGDGSVEIFCGWDDELCVWVFD